MELTTVLLAVGGWTLSSARTDHIRPADAPSRALDPVCGASILATDFYGNDLPSKVYADSVTGCCTACQNVSGCVAVTWNAAGDHHCNLKYSTAGRRTAIGEVSAILLHPAPPSPPPPPPPLPPGSPAEWLPRAAAGQLVYEVGAAVGPRPNLGNGYMATQVGSSSFYIAGVFTGDLPPPFGKSKGGVSHRAGIPALTLGVSGGTPAAMALDFERAWVETVFSGPNGASLVQRTYAHRSRMHAWITEIDVNNSGGVAPWRVPLTGALSGSPDGVVFAPPVSVGTLQCHVGTTTLWEEGATSVKVAVCLNGTTPDLVVAPHSTGSVTLVATVWTSLDTADPEAAAAADWHTTAALARGALQSEHVAAQETLWASRVEVEGDLDLATTINSSFYGILISVRDGLNYSTSPGGLPNGCYNGHVGWPNTSRDIYATLLTSLFFSICGRSHTYPWGVAGILGRRAVHVAVAQHFPPLACQGCHPVSVRPDD
eukprot:m.171938 g.171938  ORF g.171938 m.171938 type:complete len:486 (-) comp14825_c1_seq2:1217-2674(-)